MRTLISFLEYRYDFGVKGQGQIYFKPALWLTMRTPISFLEYRYEFGVKGQDHIYLKPVCSS